MTPDMSEREAALLDALRWWSDHVDKPHSMAEFDAAVEKTRALLTALASQDAPSTPPADGLDPHTLEAAAKPCKNCGFLPEKRTDAVLPTRASALTKRT